VFGVVWDLKEVPGEVLEEGRRPMAHAPRSIEAE
jgi:hypothetical protein